jgi:hypothetical protein
MSHRDPHAADTNPLHELRSIATATIECSTPTQRVLAFGLIPVILLIVGSLPLSQQSEWALQINNPTLAQLYLSNFVHSDIPHLSNNIVGFLLTMGILFPLATLTKRQWVLATLSVLVLTVGPFVVSLYTVDVLAGTEAETVVGFSGVNSAFVGMLPLFIALFVNDKIRTIGITIGATGLMGLELGVVLWIAGLHRWSVFLLAIAGSVALILAVHGHSGEGYVPRKYEIHQLVIAVILFIALPVTLIVNVDPGTNVYGHIIGLAGGFLLSVGLATLQGTQS